MTQRPLTDPNFTTAMPLGVLGLGISSPLAFANPPRPQYNPLYKRAPTLGSLLGAV